MDHGRRLQFRSKLHEAGRTDRSQRQKPQGIDLGGFDLFCEIDLLLAREQRNFAHASIINVERIRRWGGFPSYYRPVLRRHAAEAHAVDIVCARDSGKLLRGMQPVCLPIFGLVKVRIFHYILIFQCDHSSLHPNSGVRLVQLCRTTLLLNYVGSRRLLTNRSSLPIPE